MPSSTGKLTFFKKKTRTFAVIRRNNELLEEISRNQPSSNALRCLIPTFTNALRPHPRLHLLTSASAIPKQSSTSSSDSTTANDPITPPLILHTPAEYQTPLVTSWTCPPSAVPWPPQVCAAPLSTHHRLADCGHVVRTPFLTPCAANCAYISSVSAAELGVLPSFVVDAFECPICGEETDESIKEMASVNGRWCERAEEKDGHGWGCP